MTKVSRYKLWNQETMTLLYSKLFAFAPVLRGEKEKKNYSYWPWARYPERATSLYSFNGVYTSSFIFRNAFPAILKILFFLSYFLGSPRAFAS